MVAVSITVEGAFGLTWPRWKRLIQEVEQLGFAGLYCSDHFTGPFPPDFDSLEVVLALGYLAQATHRVQFGPLVAPLSLRDPVMLTRQAAALDDLSGGRMILGLGAGWNEREHTTFGYELGDMQTRMARFEEGLEVITRLLRSATPISFAGRFYQLHDAVLLPRPARTGGPSILIGGSGPKRTLPLVARYGDIWNGQHLTSDEFRGRSAHLDELLRASGRQPSDVKRTLHISVFCGRDEAELERRLRWWRRYPDFATMLQDTLLGVLRSAFSTLIGPPESIIEQLRAYGEVGVEEVMVQWWTLDDIEGLEILADQVLPHLAA